MDPAIAQVPAPFQRVHVERAASMLAAWPACDACLGRAFGKVGSGYTNPQRGTLLRAAVPAGPVPVAQCRVCEGLFGELDALAALALEALDGWEHATFLIGSRVDEDMLEREKAMQALGVTSEAEAASAELNREIGKRVAARTGKAADPKKPDIAAVVDTRFDVVELQVAPVFLYARYRKLVRDIPQTRWPCRLCKGRGCLRCGMTGKQYPTSVQELVQAPALEAFVARDADFHGMGREDIDARCLGTGRPFVLELRDPRRRTADLQALQDAMNAHGPGRVEVLGLRWSHRDDVARVKQAESVKEYRARIAFAAPVAREQLEQAVASLAAALVAQRTPARVAHRRALLTRQRAVLGLEVEEASEHGALVRVRGEAGLYIKELVSGDEGRTRPSLAELLGVPSRVTELDVIAVEDPAAASAQPVA